MIIKQNFSLRPYNTFGIDAKSRYFATFECIEDLVKIKETLPDEPLLILGGGSNILFVQDFEGLTLKNEIKGIQKIKEDPQHVWLRVGAGENWHEFVCYCLQKQYAGVENLSLIPGTVGAAPMQNIGAYGVEIKEVIHSVEAIHRDTQQQITLNNQDCAFGYRESIFKNKYKYQYIIHHVTFRLSKKPTFRVEYGAIQEILKQKNIQTLSIQAVSEVICEIRKSKLPDPAKIGNGGSFFKNPEISPAHFESIKARFEHVPAYPSPEGLVKVPAGWLIEQAGWKGKKEGKAGVHEKQALVLVNLGNAQGKDILALSQKIQDSVNELFEVKLSPEINIIP